MKVGGWPVNRKQDIFKLDIGMAVSVKGESWAKN